MQETCATYLCPPGYDRKNTASTSCSQMNCCREADSTLIKTGVECLSGDQSFGNLPSLAACARTVRSSGGVVFVYGTGSKRGRCKRENIYTSQACPQGWESDEYDFYVLQVSCDPSVTHCTSCTSEEGTTCAVCDIGHALNNGECQALWPQIGHDHTKCTSSVLNGIFDQATCQSEAVRCAGEMVCNSGRM